MHLGSDADASQQRADREPGGRPVDLAYGRQGKPHSLWTEVILTGGPIFLQMAGYTAMLFVDTFMLSYVGDDAATAVGMAGAVSFVPMCFGMGVLLLVNTLVSQAYGRDEKHLCGQFLWQGLWFAVLYSLALLPTLLVAAPFFRALGHGPDLVPLEVSYYQILTAGAIVKLLGTVVTQFLIGTNRTVLVAVAAAFGVTFNLAGNYALVLGHWGFPQMGVVGSALATVASTVLELAIMSSVIFGPKMRAMYNTLDWKLRRTELRGLLSLGIPTGASMVGEVGAWTAFNVWVMAQLGELTLTSNNYAFRYMLLSFMPAMGFGHAVTTLVGRYIGRGRPDIAVRVTHIGLVLACAYMLLCGSIQYTFGHELMAVFTPKADVQAVGAKILVFMGLYQVLDATYVAFNGGLRGAGDTRVPALVMIGLNWAFVVVGAYAIAKLAPGMGPTGPYLMLCTYGLLLAIFMWARFQFGSWRKIDLTGMTDEATAEARAAHTGLA